MPPSEWARASPLAFRSVRFVAEWALIAAPLPTFATREADGAVQAVNAAATQVVQGERLFDLVVRRGLHFGQVRQTGVVFHMLSALGSAGRLGLTAVGNSPEEARAIFDEAKRVLDEEARFDEL